MSRLIADFRDSELDPIEKASTLLHIAGDAERAWLRVLTSAGLIPAGREHLNHGEL